MILSSFAPGASAQQDEQDQPPQRAEIDAAGDETDRRIYGELNLLFSHAYYFRGTLQEDDGLIFQPEIVLGLTLIDDEDTGVTFDVFTGLWNSIHTEDDTAGDDSTTDYWYEADFYVGAALGVEDFTFELMWMSQTSPSDAFNTIDEIIFTAAYDDSEQGLLFGVPLQPSLELGVEVHNANDDMDSGVYLGLGVEPFVDLEEGVLDGATLSFPVTLGLSLNDYYQDEDGDDSAFGFVQAGAKLEIPLGIDPAYGDWTLSLGADALFLDDTTKEFNDGDDFEAIAFAKLSISF